MEAKPDKGSTEMPAWVELLRRPVSERSKSHIHLVGIGGTGLSAIATLLLELGFQVSGSDQRLNEATSRLHKLGAQIYRGHHVQNVKGADLVLISSAVPPDNVELRAAEAAHIPVVKRSAFLGPLMSGQHGIGIAGSHGKTTTTSMISIILLRAGLDPTFVIGGQLAVGPAEGMLSISTKSAQAGKGPFVIEADEYDRMFLGLELEAAVVTNVEWDHVDCYPTPAAYADAFRQFVSRLPENGYLLLCADDPGALALRDAVPSGVLVHTYGLSDEADWQARAVTTNRMRGSDAEVWYQGKQVAELSLPTPGRHNVRNALAALAIGNWHRISPKWSVIMLNDFRGAGRRFEFLGEASGVTVIDDYAHHPTEVAATLSAARLRYPTRRIWAVFQPHTYSRTKALLEQYTHAFDDADRVVLLDIYAAREKIELGMHSRQLQQHIDHPDCRYLGSIEAASDYLIANVEPEDVVLVMSAGDGNMVCQLVLAGLREREEGA